MHEIGLDTADFCKSTNVINLLICETILIIFSIVGENQKDHQDNS